MKTIKTEINLYSYDELKEKAKDKAFIEHEDFLNQLGEEFENEEGVLIKEYVKHDKEEVEDSLRINEYLFFESGEIAHIMHFTGEHEKAGTTKFYFNDKVYILN
jgi:restriction endonuclease S subunit